MSYNLVIVESASKSKTIQKYLNQSDLAKKQGEFKVVASLGHIVDLPSKGLGVDTETWTLEYTPIEQKKKVIQQLKSVVKDAKNVYLASDPDREGEAISWHIKNLLKLKKYKRITFHEITPRAIEDALTHPRDLDQPLIDAQESRRALDRVVGYKVSPLLWHRFATSSLSAGRVQSVALAEMVQRFKEYLEHKPEIYWIVTGDFDLYKTTLHTALCSRKTADKIHFTVQEEVTNILKSLKKETPWSLTFEKKLSKINPSAPYTTSSLQQEAYEKYSIPAKQTMSYAQALYEQGYITYMRTDSVNLSQEAKNDIHEYLRDVFGENSVVDRTFKNKVANAQEAHECIRPSDFSKTSDQLKEDLTTGHRKIYDLIWRKAVASQMQPAEYVNYHFTITNTLSTFKDYAFKGKVSFVQTLGYLEIWNPKQKVEQKEIDKWDKLSQQTEIPLTLLKAMGEGNVTKPTGLYNEPSIIKWMEKEGIGRPSTYSTIIDKLITKGYVTKGSNPPSVVDVEHFTLEHKEITTSKEVITLGGNEKDRFVPSSLGERVIDYLKHVLPTILNKDFTSEMEEELDKISRNEATKLKVLQRFYKDFEHHIKDAQQEQKQHQNDDKKEKKELKPADSNILKQFKLADIIQTRYGPAIFIKESKRFVAVVPFMQWKGKEIQDVTEKDVHFLTSFPKQYEDITVEMGRYGLYIVHEKNNHHLPKEDWDKVYEDTITYKELQGFVKASLAKPKVPYTKKYTKKT